MAVELLEKRMLFRSFELRRDCIVQGPDIGVGSLAVFWGESEPGVRTLKALRQGLLFDIELFMLIFKLNMTLRWA